jgi:hypothetical protein
MYCHLLDFIFANKRKNSIQLKYPDTALSERNIFKEYLKGEVNNALMFATVYCTFIGLLN